MRKVPRILLRPQERGKYLDHMSCRRRPQGLRANDAFEGACAPTMPGLRWQAASSWFLRSRRGRVAWLNTVVAHLAYALHEVQKDPCIASVVYCSLSTNEDPVPGIYCTAVVLGESWRRLLKRAARDLRTLKRWAQRWRKRAPQTVPWLASLVVETNPQSEPPRYSAEEAPPATRGAVVEELWWLDALGVELAKHNADDDIRGWSWMNVRFAGRPEWF